MKARNQPSGVIRILFGFAIFATAAFLAARHLIPIQTFGILFASGYLIYVWGCARFAKARGYSAMHGIFAAFFPLLLLLLPNKAKMSKAERAEYDQIDREEEKERAARRAPLRGPKKAVAWLMALFFLTLGAAIVAGYQVYWIRVVMPERNALATAIEIDSNKLDSQNDGKLVHVVGQLAGAENLSDAEFGVATNALRLRRRVWMYQWIEGGRQSKSSYSVEDTKGNSTTLYKSETYDYNKDWSEKVINSSAFHNSGHDNPTEKKIADYSTDAAKITLGAFAVAPKLVEQIDNFQNISVTETNLTSLAAPLRAQAKISDGEIYFGANPNEPAVGDLKVRFELAPVAVASVIAQQNGNSLSPYAVPNAGSVALLKIGNVSTAEMVAEFAKTNSQQRMIVFIAGGILILFGFLLAKIAGKR